MSKNFNKGHAMKITRSACIGTLLVGIGKLGLGAMPLSFIPLEWEF